MQCAQCGSSDWGPHGAYRQPYIGWTIVNGQRVPLHSGQCQYDHADARKRARKSAVPEQPRVSSSKRVFRGYREPKPYTEGTS